MNEMKQKGLLTELHCQLAFTELGFLVMQPLSEDTRYDFVVDIGGKFLRIQCKTCSPKEDGSAISFACRSTRSNTQDNVSRKYTKEEIDYFYTYYWGKSYLVPVEECSSDKTLRFIRPVSGQKVGISFAKDYELKKVLQSRENISTFQEINYSIIPLTEDASLEEVAEKRNTKTTNCPICGQPKTPDAKTCVPCYQKSLRRVERPNREELKSLIRNTPFTSIGKIYKVTDNAIRNWCKMEKLPYKVGDIKQYSDEEWEKL